MTDAETTNIPASILIAEAASLLSAHGENTEYDRGVAELTAFLLGWNLLGLEAVLARLRAHPQSAYEGTMTNAEKLELIKEPWDWSDLEDDERGLSDEQRAVVQEWLEFRDEYHQLTDIELAETFLGGKLVLA